jgi:hypothetical protein
MPSETKLVVDPPRGTRQRSVRDLRNGSNGSVTETYLDFRDDGVYLERVKTTTTFGPITDVRDLRPKQPVRVATPDAGPGSHVEFTMTGSNTTAKVEITLIRLEHVTIDGTSVDTIMVRTETKFSGDLQGEGTSETWFTLDRLLPVKEHSVTEASTGGNSFHSEYRAELHQLSPS